ncbi:CGNR zinc finger domain-containing protein [Phytohabitans aurantiacus]|uniref:CGNR zinc finger domain-containing protein n=1 Tax=Phytohabitans aurantiacus TaxID=3016789 RepID=UPI0024928B5C|nr:ABATE domain-containing protein [Phytohabitans aurantiacus]
MERFGFIGGHPALDFVNTLHWRLAPSRHFDALTTFDDLVTWSSRAGILDARETATLRSDVRGVAADAVDDARGLREAIYEAAMSQDVADALAHAFTAGLHRARLTRGNRRWAWQDVELGPNTPADRLARSAVELLTSERSAAIRQCADAECGWIYLDTSRAENRRWCSASGCGDRNRARDYYRRRTAAAADTSSPSTRRPGERKP